MVKVKAVKILLACNEGLAPPTGFKCFVLEGETDERKAFQLCLWSTVPAVCGWFAFWDAWSEFCSNINWSESDVMLLSCVQCALLCRESDSNDCCMCWVWEQRPVWSEGWPLSDGGNASSRRPWCRSKRDFSRSLWTQQHRARIPLCSSADVTRSVWWENWHSGFFCWQRPFRNYMKISTDLILQL